MQMLSILKHSFTGWISRTCLKIGGLNSFFHIKFSIFVFLDFLYVLYMQTFFFCSKHHRMDIKMICNQKSRNFWKFWLKFGVLDWKKLLCSKHHRMGRKMICNQKSRIFWKFWLCLGHNWLPGCSRAFCGVFAFDFFPRIGKIEGDPRLCTYTYLHGRVSG